MKLQSNTGARHYDTYLYFQCFQEAKARGLLKPIGSKPAIYLESVSKTQNKTTKSK